MGKDKYRNMTKQKGCGKCKNIDWIKSEIHLKPIILQNGCGKKLKYRKMKCGEVWGEEGRKLLYDLCPSCKAQNHSPKSFNGRSLANSESNRVRFPAKDKSGEATSSKENSPSGFNKLKTLKDIKLDYERESNLRKNIKKEAIKWVKFYRSKLGKHDSVNWNIIYHRLSQEFMLFHNITEDDLK